MTPPAHPCAPAELALPADLAEPPRFHAPAKHAVGFRRQNKSLRSNVAWPLAGGAAAVARESSSPWWTTATACSCGPKGATATTSAACWFDEDLSSDDPICAGNVTIDAAAFSAGLVSFHCSNTASGFDFILTDAP